MNVAADRIDFRIGRHLRVIPMALQHETLSPPTKTGLIQTYNRDILSRSDCIPREV